MLNTEKHFISLAQETRTVIPTENAAYHLNRKEHTLRCWACHEDGPFKPVRINGRLAWSVEAIKELLNGGNNHA